MLSIKVKKKTMLIYMLFIVLLYETIAKYIGVTWESTIYSNVVSMQGKTIVTLKCIEFIIVLLLGLAYNHIERTQISLAGCTLLLSGILWSIININSGLALIYLDTPPVLLIELGILIMVFQDNDVRERVLSFVKILTVFFIGLTIYDLVYFLSQYRLVRMANGNIIEHYANALFLLAVLNSMSGTDKDRKKFIMYFAGATLCVVSVFITSRGWILQAILLLASMYLTTSNKSFVSKISHVILAIIGFGIIYAILSYYLNDALGYVLNRIGEDTRTSQLDDFFSQVPIWKLVLGQGPSATYYHNGGAYAYIDNIYLFWMFRYGIVPVIAYWSLFLRELFVKKSAASKQSSLPHKTMILMWLLAMGGVCIYYGIRLDIANIVLLAAVINLKKGGEKELIL